MNRDIKQGNIKHIINHVLRYRKSLLIVLIALITVSASLLLMGLVFRNLVDNGLGSDEISEIHQAILSVSILIMLFSVGSFLRSYFINVIALQVISKLKSDTYRSLLQINIEKYENLKIGDLVSRLGSDIETIGGLIVNFFSFFLRNMIMLTGAVLLMFVQSPKLSLFVIVSVPVLLFPLLKLSRHVRSLARSVMAEQGKIAANIDESFSGIRTLYAYNQQQYLADRFDSKMKSYIKQASLRLRLRSTFFALAIILISGSITGVIWIGSIDIIDGDMSSGQMLSFIYYAIIVGMSAGGIAEMFSEIQTPLAALDRVIELRNISMESVKNISSELDARDKGVSKQLDEDYSIEFKEVSFAYPARSDISVLDNISLKIEQGSFSAIVGASGSGKSTLMQLLLKFYHYKKGQILIGNTDINLLNEDEIRKKIAYVEQHPMIFSGTIKSNITFSCPDASDAEINRVIELCGINEFTQNLKEGINTEIGERGVRISGGQKQRIAIARALLYKPEILLLDEATSALDNNSEKKILDNIKKFMKDKTIISIAHRVSSIEDADQIYLIEQGRIIGQGKHENLLQSSKKISLIDYVSGKY